ncbi:MAG TPA: condensation domain-containing protein, partial [Streptosporangiaceae bacterium]|nr:condensation domain-containing protein [Streptosporangiaceae bacterium]
MSGTYQTLSSTQRRMWFADQVQPGDIAYNIPVVLRVRGVLDVGVLQGGLDVVVGRHSVLRSRFCVVDGEPVAQVVAGARVV